MLELERHLLCGLSVVVGAAATGRVRECLRLLLLLELGSLLLRNISALRLGDLQGWGLLRGRRRSGLVPFAFALVDPRLYVEQDVGCPFFPIRIEVLDAVRLVFVDAAAVEHHGDVFADVKE